MKDWNGTLGELIATIYEECESEFGDIDTATEVTHQIVNELIEEETPTGFPIAA